MTVYDTTAVSGNLLTREIDLNSHLEKDNPPLYSLYVTAIESIEDGIICSFIQFTATR